jgi:hypothetical protein
MKQWRERIHHFTKSFKSLQGSRIDKLQRGEGADLGKGYTLAYNWSKSSNGIRKCYDLEQHRRCILRLFFVDDHQEKRFQEVKLICLNRMEMETDLLVKKLYRVSNGYLHVFQ